MRTLGNNGRFYHRNEQPTPKPKPRIEYQRITSAELDTGDYSVEYLIDGILVAGQPMIVSGAFKTLKTSVLIDMALSLSLCDKFLGHFPVRRAANVAVMSGESGLGTLQETARRVAETKGRRLSDFDVIWSPSLPKFDDRDHYLYALSDFLTNDEIEILIIDPAYLCMPGADAGNLFTQGGLLANITEVCNGIGVQIILCHHNKKNTGRDAFEPPELQDIAWSGFAEWCRQWLLLGRRAAYEPGTGSHGLWLNVGGSAGHSGLWALDIEEGEYKPSQPRKWDATVTSASAARKEARIKADRAKARKQGVKDEERKRRLWQTMKEDFPDGETKTTLKNATSMNTTNFDNAIRLLKKEGRAEACKVEKNSKSHDGWKPLDPGKVTTRTTRTDPDKQADSPTQEKEADNPM